MTNEEIKKEFNKVKKAMIKKDETLTGCFRMTAKQLANRTATVCLCNNIEYDDEIDMALYEHMKVQAYTSWTDEEKARNKKEYDESIAKKKERKAMYGTKENEAKKLAEMITGSDEFKRFQEMTGATTSIELTHLWLDLSCYYLRISY